MRSCFAIVAKMLSVFEDPAAVEGLLGEAAVADAVLCQALQVMQRFEHAFTAEAVERPEQRQVEFPLTCVVDQAPELFAVRALPTGLVDVLADDAPILRRGELSELLELVLHVLSQQARMTMSSTAPPWRLNSSLDNFDHRGTKTRSEKCAPPSVARLNL
jgi:hypothetical protein